ncbi:MAG: PAS domain S-box protein [Ferruginibacter sp.]|nr:PAS domain S-box protein [Cytophagales bacterium]
MIDLIESQEIKEALAARPQDALSIIEDTDIGICITNDQGNFVAVNDAYCRVYGYDRSELVGHAFTIVVPEANQETMNTLHRKFMRDKREISREWEVRRKTGELISISVDTAFNDQVFGGPHKITFVHQE